MYFLIGISLLFAYLYAVNLSASLVTTAAWKFLHTPATRWSGKTRANLIFFLRLIPLAASLIFILAFILPSYLMFEPDSTGETISYKLAIIVGISVFGMTAALGRIFASWWKTRRLIAEWMRNSEPVDVIGVSLPAYKLRHAFPVIAVVGVLRPKIFVAEQVLAELSEAELTAAISHEAGHVSSRDNLKRIAMRLCGDLLVFPLGKTLDQVWLESAESAADEYAAEQGGGRSALDLASALVKIGRIAPEKKVWDMPMAAYLIEPDDGSLASRVDGLIHIAGSGQIPIGRGSKTYSFTAYAILGFFTISIAMLALNNNFLMKIHSISEALLAFLQ